MTAFIPEGPPRYRHQKIGLRKLIECRGTAALLFEPGTGKTATALDYLSLLALRNPERSHLMRFARVLPVTR